jgi:ABC-type uncharacterized transport system permease subunit
MVPIALPLTLIACTVGIVSTALAIVYRSDVARRAATLTWPAAWLGLLAAIASHGLAQGRFPLSNVAEYLLVLAWAMLSLHLFAWFGPRVYVAGLVLPPISLVATLSGWNLLGHPHGVSAARPRGLFVVHTTLSTLGIAALGLAFTMSVIYLLQDRALKSKQSLSLLERLPSLDKSDHLGYHAMLVGFILLSLGLTSGTGFKQLFAALAWLVFAGVIAARAACGFRGRKSAYLTIAGFALGLLTVLGMTL